MTIRDHLQVLRRRLPIVVVALVVGVVAGWLSAPGETDARTAFRATHIVIFEAQGSQSYNIEQLALLTTSGAVPSRVAARLGIDRAQVRSAVSGVADAKVGTISITARSSEAARAVSLADATAEELVAETDGGARVTYEAEVSRLTSQVQAARAHLTGTKSPGLQAAAQVEIASAERALQEYQSQGPPKSQLRTLESAMATADSPEGVQAPQSRAGRALLLGGVGLLFGVATAIALHRLDSRIRSKSSAEQAFGAPVVAEVPPLPKSSQGQLLTRTQPSSAFVEAYRGLRTYVALWAPANGGDDGHRVIVVTSPGAGEGKTTTVAHLAAMLAEIGRSVVVVSADLRRPRLHEYFDRPATPGLVDVLAAAPGAPVFDDLDLGTSVRGVRLVASGPPVENPAPLLEGARELLRAARGLADFVLVDSPPLLVANDAVDLARHADGVLLVCRAGKTPLEAAQRSAELLERLGIPVVGAVLAASDSASGSSGYYGSRYYAETPERTGWSRRRRAGGNTQQPARETPAPEEAPSAAQTPPVLEGAPPAVNGLSAGMPTVPEEAPLVVSGP